MGRATLWLATVFCLTTTTTSIAAAAVATNSSTSLSSSEVVACRLCGNATNAIIGDPEARFQVQGTTMTCQQVYDQDTWSLSRADCSSLQTWGQVFCLCYTNSQDNNIYYNSSSDSGSYFYGKNNNNCSLCQNQPNVPFASYEGLPSTTCAQLQVEAQRDDPTLCSVWQNTVGMYCKCDNTATATSICRICGRFPLPNPLLEMVVVVAEGAALENNNNQTTSSTAMTRSTTKAATGTANITTTWTTTPTPSSSCGELEFQANRPNSNCSAFQERYGDGCCRNLNVAVLTSAGLSSNMQQHSRVVLAIVISLVLQI